MADLIYSRPGTNSLAGHAAAYYHNEGDGSYSEAVAARLRGWDATDGAWYRIPVDHATGALLVKATLSTGSVDIGSVDQGTGGNSAWKVDGSAVTQPISGTVAVSNFPATQPVSLASMPSTPVTGTFWQATQPVSAAALPLPTGAATDVQLAALVGQPSDGRSPAAYTVLDTLRCIRKTLEQQAKTAQALLDASKPTVKAPQPLTLLHRR